MGLFDRIGLKIAGSKLKGRLRAWVPLLAGAGFVFGAVLKLTGHATESEGVLKILEGLGWAAEVDGASITLAVGLAWGLGVKFYRMGSRALGREVPASETATGDELAAVVEKNLDARFLDRLSHYANTRGYPVDKAFARARKDLLGR